MAVIRQAPDLALVDQSGKTIKLSDLKGKVLLVSFVFTTCTGSCPATTPRMSLVAQELKRRGLLNNDQCGLLSITLDPERDRPEVLRDYMRLYDADPNDVELPYGPA